MRKLPPKLLILSALVLSFLASQSAVAELWNCNGLYTDNKPPGAQCTRVRSLKVCGAGRNKFFSPGDPESERLDTECSPEQTPSSPIVNEKLLEVWRKERQVNRPAPPIATVASAEVQEIKVNPRKPALHNSPDEDSPLKPQKQIADYLREFFEPKKR